LTATVMGVSGNELVNIFKEKMDTLLTYEMIDPVAKTTKEIFLNVL